MKTIIVKIASLILILSLCFSLYSCGVNSYSAFMLVRTSTANEFNVSFESLSGSLSQKLSNSYTQDTTMSVEATLAEGEMEIYYSPATYEGELPLYKLSGGESVSLPAMGYLTNGESAKIYIRIPEGMSAKGGRVTVTINDPTR